jgi:hypothetical protein
MVLKHRNFRKIHIERSEVWCWRMVEKINLSSSVRNEVSCTQSEGGKENPTYNKTKEG